MLRPKILPPGIIGHDLAVRMNQISHHPQIAPYRFQKLRTVQQLRGIEHNDIADTVINSVAALGPLPVLCTVNPFRQPCFGSSLQFRLPGQLVQKTKRGGKHPAVIWSVAASR
ncbi:hypothetical protein D3C77_594450 [compost metagenome]